MKTSSSASRHREESSRGIVITLTPNPALDLSGTVPFIVPNEKNSVRNERRDPGGNGINAARVAGRLGTPVLALGFAGGSTGMELETLLRREGIPHRFTRIAGTTRTNVTVSVEQTHQQTRLSFPGPRIRADEQRRLHEELERTARRHPGSLLLIGGSLPPGMHPIFWSRCLAVARRHRCEVSLDLPARALKDLFPPEKSLSRPIAPLFLKPNDHELAEWSGEAGGLSLEALARTSSRLVRASGAAFVLVSMGARGALLANGEGACRLTSPRVHARGTVGAGDSTVGALASALLAAGWTERKKLKVGLRDWLSAAPGAETSPPRTLLRAFQLGLAAGAATAEQAGTALARPARIRALSREVTVAETFPRC